MLAILHVLYIAATCASSTPPPLQFSFGQLFSWIDSDNYQRWTKMVCLGQIRVDKTKLEQIMTWPNFIFDQLFMWIGANNGQRWLHNGLDEWFWAMFKPTAIWPNFTFGQLFIWIGANNDQMWLHMGRMSDSEQCSNGLQLDLISHFVNFSCELGQINSRYVFLLTRGVILSNVRTDSQLDINSLLGQLSIYELGQIMTRYDFLWTKKVILSNIQTESNFT